LNVVTAFLDTSPDSDRVKKFGVSVSDSARVRTVFPSSVSGAIAASNDFESLLKSRSVASVLRFRRSRNGRSPSGEAPSPVR
jgi:hypothetical protein